MYRLFTIGVILLWLFAMSALFIHDVWPTWTAQDPPLMSPEQFAALEDYDEQYAIIRQSEDGTTDRIGTAWHSLSTPGGLTSIQGTLFIEGVHLIPVIRVETITEFDSEGQLDRFMLNVHGVPMTTIQLQGERRGIFFPCHFQVGPLERDFNLDLTASRMIGDSLRPFSYLPGLEVGQSWRMQIVDPMMAVSGRRAELKSVIVRVTGKGKIMHLGNEVESYIIETQPESGKAWIDAQGRVLRQKVKVPVVGEITIIAEPFDESTRSQARQRVRARAQSAIQGPVEAN